MVIAFIEKRELGNVGHFQKLEKNISFQGNLEVFEIQSIQTWGIGKKLIFLIS